MRKSSNPTSLWKTLINLAVLAVFVAAEAALVQGSQRILDTWQSIAAAQLLGCLLAAGVALRLRAKLAAYTVAAFASMIIAELGVHLYYGIRSAQGAATHFAVLGSAALGVGLGVILAGFWHRDRKVGDSRRSEDSELKRPIDVGGVPLVR